MSVVVPLYNKGPYIGEAVDSVLRQTYGRLELILVDDGSTDGSASVVNAWQDPRLRLLNQPNRGPGAARNRGIDGARGEWVAFLDADDFWHPRFLERALSFTEAHREVGAVFCGISTIPGGEDILRHMPRRDVVVPDYFHSVLLNRGSGMTSSSTLVRRATLRAIGGFREDVRRGEDGDMWARIAWSVPVGYVAETLAVYRRGIPDSLTTQARTLSPPDPPLLDSYSKWSAAGRIPEALAGSSLSMAKRLLFEHAAELTNKGESGRAVQALLSHAGLGFLPLARMLEICLRAMLPQVLLHEARRLAALDKVIPAGGHPGVPQAAGSYLQG